MQALFYTIKQDPKYLTKDLYFHHESSIVLKEMEDLLDLTIEVEPFDDWLEVNYIYLDTFKRYYFIRTRKMNLGGSITLALHGDVLMTQREKILNKSCYILRQENLFNPYFIDPYEPLRCDFYMIKEHVGSVGDGSGNCIAFNVLNNQVRA